MKIKSAIITEASGSLGGFTASHNRGGLYLRARTIPTNPNTSYQQVIRAAVAQLTSLWMNTLTAGQREAWDIYAFNVELPDTLGEPRNVGGLQMYVRSNVPRIQIGLPRVDIAPVIFNLGDFGSAGMGNASAAVQTYDFTWSFTDLWPSEDDAACLLYVSRPQNPSINYFKGPYRVFHSIPGNNGDPPVAPLDRQVPFAFVEAQRLFMRCQVSRADGRLSNDQFLTTVAVA